MGEEELKKKLKKIGPCLYELPKEGPMKVPARFILNEKLLEQIEPHCVAQARNVTTLPGIQKWGITCPDAHEGYGFPIGGVAAMDAEEGCISPGGIGYDINCGVRLLVTDLDRERVHEKINEIVEALFKHVPCGLGSKKAELKLAPEELDKVLAVGARWAVKNGYGTEADLEHCESNGSLEAADASCVSKKAKDRGKAQLDTLGSGNHFLEVQYVDKIFDEKTAEAFGIKKEGQVTVLIHTGSRGLGHQVCTDYLREMEQAYPELVEQLPDKELIYTRLGTDLADRYFKAMCAAANFAWCNRHMIGHHVRTAFEEVFGKCDLKTIYDVAHNIAKLEEHTIDGKKRKVMMHRKGATRAFPPGHPEIPKAHREVGQPVLLPGTMGTASYVLVGTKKGMELAFGSAAHGAGRAMSRSAALKQYRGELVKKNLSAHDIVVKSASWKGIAEEAPGAYKDVDEVIKASHDSGIAKKVVRMRPMGVVKG